MPDLVIGGIRFQVIQGKSERIPAFAAKIIGAASKLPDDTLMPTRDILRKIGYSHLHAGTQSEPCLEPFRIQLSYHVTLWGNKRTIQRAKRANKSR